MNDSKKERIIKTVGWTFAVIFFLSAFASISSHPPVGVILILLGLVLLPKTKDFIQKRFNYAVSWKIKTASFVILFIAFLIAMPGSGVKTTADNVNQPKQAQESQSVSSSSVTPSPQSAESKIPEPKTEQQIVEEKLKAISSASYRSLEIEKADSDRPQGSKMITASFNAPSFWDKNGLLRDTGKISFQVFQTIFSSKLSAYDVFVWYYGDTTDRYGNKKNDVVLTYHMYKPTFDKINWQNFDQKALCDFLNQENKLNPDAIGNACTVLAKIE